MIKSLTEAQLENILDLAEADHEQASALFTGPFEVEAGLGIEFGNFRKAFLLASALTRALGPSGSELARNARIAHGTGSVIVYWPGLKVEGRS